MAKIGRNDPCPCGSGKKYKKCCLGKIDEKEFAENYSFVDFIRVNNSIELLKIFSLVQLLPKNHSKVVRLETIQDTIVSNLNTNTSKVNYSSLVSTVHDQFGFDYREDPSESSFTENLTYVNGNNVVYPGIAHEATNVNQCLLNSIIWHQNKFSDKFKTHVGDGAVFMLHVHNTIAQKLGHVRYMYEEDYREQILFPDEEYVNKYIDLLQFTEEEIQGIYDRYNLTSGVINEFVSEISDVKANNGEETILIRRPFIKVEDTYYLTLPCAQMYCLNQFILRVAKEENQLKVLEASYDEIIMNDSSKYLRSLWNKTGLEVELPKEETIWKFDKNKYCYVRNLSSSSRSNFEKQAENAINKAKKEISEDDIEFLCLHIISPLDISEMAAIPFQEIKNAKYQIVISCFDLGRLISYWDLDSLSLWKFARARERAEQKSLTLAPFYSFLAYYKWYSRNKESFFPSDEAAPTHLFFDFSMQGEVVIEANRKEDKHFIRSLHEHEGMIYVPVLKTKTYAPIYVSEEIFGGYFRMALEKYSCPIWVSLFERYDRDGANFVEAILYWLNELYEPLVTNFNQLGKYPLELTLKFEKNFREQTEEEVELFKTKKIIIGYDINLELRKILLEIPKNIFKALHRNDNYGERLIMDAVLRGVNNFLEIFGYNYIHPTKIEQILEKHMPLSRAKMILTSEIQENIKMDNRFLPKPRYVYDADIAIILEENINWLGEDELVPEEIPNTESKVALCLKLINSLIGQLKKRLEQYNSKELLNYLLPRHEAILQRQALRDLSVVSRYECFKHYEDVVKDYEEFNTTLVKSSQAHRCLIEFVVAEPFHGSKKVNDDDADFMIALMSEIINYGALKDSIKFEIDNPKMGLLPSGRIGISHEFYDNILSRYSTSIAEDDLIDYDESFDGKFKSRIRNTNKTESKKDIDPYYKKVDEEFINDWGISLPMIFDALLFLAMYCLENKDSYFECTEDDFHALLKENTDLDNSQMESFIEQMTLETRGKMEAPKSGVEYHEIYPWRYNRKYSYLRRPIIKIKNLDGSFDFAWSPRHLYMSSYNLMHLFHNGTLKVESNHKNISRLLAERNKIKGKEFREDVYDWLVDNSKLQLIPSEITIKERGTLKADRDYGDIDILGIDEIKRVIYSIECKNTKQAKTMYDFQNHIKNYVDKQLPKHKRREDWLKQNKKQVISRFSLKHSNYKIKSLVISSYQVPIKFIDRTVVPVYSFNEIKRKPIF